jgi:hypothetical protein
LLPLRSPTPFFAWIENTGCFFRGSFTSPSNAREFIFPATLQALQNLTGSDVLNSIYLDTPVFGFKMDTDQAQKLIEEYYRCVEAGTPFLSCFPDGFVLSALLNKPELSLWKPVPCDKLLAPFESENLSPINVERLKKEGYFFAQRSKKLSSN